MDVFLLGAPRSGTTWLQTMLGAHPAIAAPQETGVFHRFLAPWADEFERKVDLAERLAGDERVVGLPVVLTRERFDELLRHAFGVVHDGALEMKPGASIVVDKNPENAKHVDLIRRVVPHARFVHIVRDGRDVAASLVAASATWGGRWAPNDVRDAASVWRAHVLGARSAAAAGEAYCEVRYEDLLADGPSELARVLHHCGVDTTVDEASEIDERFTFDRMVESRRQTFETVLLGGEARRSMRGPAREPEGFFRFGRNGSWHGWTARECWAFDDAAGDLLVELGYEASRDWCQPETGPARAARRLSRDARTVKRRARRAAGSLVRRVVTD